MVLVWPKALDDCNGALRRMNKTDRAYGGALGSRGLTQLRLGAFGARGF
jgi:hypothetical protein